MPFLPFADRVKSFELIEKGLTTRPAPRKRRALPPVRLPDVGCGHLQRLSLEHGLTENKLPPRRAGRLPRLRVRLQHDSPSRDLNKCINCTHCVRICRDVIGAVHGLMGAATTRS